ncbi:MAG: entericidin A/B family lipoprotein [Desulfobulbaceae bacterium]|nr:entericidin A/B family lipoprotein [Desulfobulbaceae bacterium]
MKRHSNSANSHKRLLNWIALHLLAAIATGVILSAAGCNTMNGLGKDVEKAGEAIQKSVK